MASSGAQRSEYTVSSSTTSYILTMLYRPNFRKILMSQKHPANPLSLDGSRNLNRRALLRTSTLS